MGKKDTATKDYMKDSKIFADAFNQMIYEGEQVIQPEKLRPLDSTVIGLPHGKEGVRVSVQKQRDNIKCLAAMEDDSATYLILGVENQSEVHYAMPVKDLLYDALQYAAQVEEIAQKHKEERLIGSSKKPNTGEYLSGFYKEDCLAPVITLVSHFGAEEWDGPMSLHDMLAVKDPKILPFVPDYKLNLLSPAGMSDEELNRFTTSLREVMLFIKYSKDKARLNEMLQTDAGFRNLDRKAANVIGTVTGTKIEMKEEEEEVNMCEAIQGMLDDATLAGLQKGKQEGKREGKLEGMREGKLEGMREGKREGVRTLAMRMLSEGSVTVEYISMITNLTVEEIRAIDAGRKAQSE